MSHELPIFLNPGSGGGTEADALRSAFEAAGATVTMQLTHGKQLESAVAAAGRAGAKVIAVAGGDGTVSAAANALVGTDCALLPIPTGTMNHFAQRYGVAGIDAAVLAWQRSAAEVINVGTVNERVFVNNASCGFYPHVVRQRERLESVFPRIPAMWLAGLRVLVGLPIMKLDIEIAGQRRRLRTPALWVGIGRNSLRLPAPGNVQEGAILEGVSGSAATRLGVLSMAFRLFRHLKQGEEPSDERLDVFHARQFAVESRRSVDIALDGEPYRMRAPLRFALKERALRVLCLVAPGV